MLELIADTETTGLWNFKRPFEAPEQPDLAQLAFRVVEDDKCLMTFSSLVSDCEHIPADASAITGITNDVCQMLGFKRKTVLTFFSQALARVGAMVCHNAAFDRLVLLRALWKAGLPFWPEELPVLCTKNSTTDILKLPGKYGKPKWPTLNEAYRALVDPNGFEGAHDALVDVDACWRVLRAVRREGHPVLSYQANV